MNDNNDGPSQAEEVAILKSGFASFKQDFDDFKNEIRQWMTAQNDRSKINWPAIGVLMGVLGAGWYVIQLQTQLEIQSRVAPVANQTQFLGTSDNNQEARIRSLEGQAISLIEKATRSESDRQNINRAIDEIKSSQNLQISDQKSFASSILAQLTEVETQFRAADQSHNVQWANQLRWTSLLWEKSYGQKFPSEIQYYPSIAQPPRP